MCNYFAHGTGEFFSVDSYSGIDYKEIPTYTSTRVDPEVREPSGEFDLRDTVDFRPRVADATIDTATTIQSQTAHKVTSNHLTLVQGLLLELVHLQFLHQKIILNFNMILISSW